MSCAVRLVFAFDPCYFRSRGAPQEDRCHRRGAHHGGGGKVFAMIQAYLDETSIHEGAGACAIAGYFGGPGQWKRQGRQWAEILKRYKVEEFHAKQFWGFDDKGKRVGPYKDWPDTEASAFLNELISTIETHPKLHPISSVVVMQSWNKLSHNQRRFLTGGRLINGKFKSSGCPSKPYFLPFQSCIVDAAAHAPIGGKAHYFFDLNKQFKGYALDCFALLKNYPLMVKDRLGDIDFKTGLEAVQLQAADLYCYQFYQFALRKIANPSEKPDGLHMRLLRGHLPGADKFINDKAFEFLLKGVNIPPDK